MAKAYFNKVWHQGLLYKLKTIFPICYYLLFKSYLEHRHFTVSLGSGLSKISPINAEVLQGAVVAPILFNLYTSDQPTTKNTITDDFANDKAIVALYSEP